MSANEALDSLQAHQRLSAIWPAESGRVFASLSRSSEGDTSASSVYSENLSADEEEQLESVLEEVSRIPSGSEERAYFVIGNRTGPAVRRVERLGQCAPRIRNRSILTARIAEQVRVLNISQEMVVRLYVMVEEDGVVSEVRINESSGDMAVDLAAARVFRGVTFSPGRVEDIPTPVWASFPVTFTPSGRGQSGAD